MGPFEAIPTAPADVAVAKPTAQKAHITEQINLALPNNCLGLALPRFSVHARRSIDVDKLT
jgi:hypothetical protein